jgi:hypothetical protein
LSKKLSIGVDVASNAKELGYRKRKQENLMSALSAREKLDRQRSVDEEAKRVSHGEPLTVTIDVPGYGRTRVSERRYQEIIEARQGKAAVSPAPQPKPALISQFDLGAITQFEQDQVNYAMQAEAATAEETAIVTARVLQRFPKLNSDGGIYIAVLTELRGERELAQVEPRVRAQWDKTLFTVLDNSTDQELAQRFNCSTALIQRLRAEK